MKAERPARDIVKHLRNARSRAAAAYSINA